MKTPQTYPCTRCEGKGRLPHYANVLGGVCFKCGGTGRQKTRPAAPSRRWSVNAIRTTDHHDCVVFHVRAKTEREALNKASAALSRAREQIYDPTTIRVTPWPDSIEQALGFSREQRVHDHTINHLKEHQMSTIQLTPAQHAILAYAVEHTGGKIEWFPDNVKGGARKKVLDGLANRALIARQGEVWVVADAGYEALGVPRPGARTAQRQSFVAQLDAVIARAEQAQTARDEADLEAAVTAAEAAWAQDAHRSAEPRRTRENSKQAQVIAMLRRPEGATVRQICELTGWQPHTVRGTLAGALKKKLGLTIVSERSPGGERVYRLA
ncbi:DUF3489 domain-containing protein [Gulbenkiania mobilis]|uniref:DUF3489 domain-containing protein n=1 Tax=Gulbenkiania mobilis TaxID=397457 RepID=UPI000B1850C8|nr:DUF3489 domain-containing protein [Gulbenkiania mobilis]